VPDPKVGEEICVYIRLREGAILTEEDIVDYAKDKVSHLPRQTYAYRTIKNESDSLNAYIYFCIVLEALILISQCQSSIGEYIQVKIYLICDACVQGNFLREDNLNSS
jgi:hypothetical protein